MNWINCFAKNTPCLHWSNPIISSTKVHCNQLLTQILHYNILWQMCEWQTRHNRFTFAPNPFQDDHRVVNYSTIYVNQCTWTYHIRIPQKYTPWWSQTPSFFPIPVSYKLASFHISVFWSNKSHSTSQGNIVSTR